MADFKTHVTTSSVLGLGVGAGASLLAGFTPVQGALAGCLTGVAGMFPDLDSQSGRPVREIFGVTAALAPLVMLERLRQWGGDNESAMLLAILLYVSIRYGAGAILSLVAVHRGMFHSIPAMVIAAELAFLSYASENINTKLLMAFGVAAGFLSHLVLDEIYSVELSGLAVKLKSSAGTAVKFFGNSVPANILTYGLAFTLGYGVMIDGGLWNSIQDDVRAADRRSAPDSGERGRSASGANSLDRIDSGSRGTAAAESGRETANGKTGSRNPFSITGTSRKTNTGGVNDPTAVNRRPAGSNRFDDLADEEGQTNSRGQNNSGRSPTGRGSAVGATDRRIPR